jgi:acyl-CoA thioester hydrolase
MTAPHITEVPLRFCDTDRLGHVNNAVYAVLCEAGRAEMLQSVGLLEPSSAHAVVIARLELDFLREMNWPGTAVVESAIHQIGTKSFRVRHRIRIGDMLCARALSVLAVMSTETRRAVPLEQAWRDAFGQWFLPDFI